MILCCDAWPQSDSPCYVVASDCPAPRLSIALSRLDADAGATCPAGTWDCLATEWDSCCEQSCIDDPRCAIDRPTPRPSCCVGYCGMVGSSVSPECASGPAMASGCCGGLSMALKPGAPIASAEWTVAFDFPDPVDASSFAPEAAVTPEPSPEAQPAEESGDNGVGSPSGGCSVGRSGTSSWALGVMAVFGVAAMRVRRRR